MTRTIREILQTETIYTDEKIVKGGAKYYIDENGNKQYLLPAPSEIRKRYNNDEQLFRRSVPYIEGTREGYEDMIQRYFRPTEDDLKAEQEYWGYYPNNTSLPHLGQQQSLFPTIMRYWLSQFGLGYLMCISISLLFIIYSFFRIHPYIFRSIECRIRNPMFSLNIYLFA